MVEELLSSPINFTLILLASVWVVTCKTMGSCSGGLRLSEPWVSHTWNAVSCSAKNGLWVKLLLSSRMLSSCDKHRSRARSHACLHTPRQIKLLMHLFVPFRNKIQFKAECWFHNATWWVSGNDYTRTTMWNIQQLGQVIIYIFLIKYCTLVIITLL